MVKQKRFYSLVAVLCTMILSGSALAHTTVMSKNTPDAYSTRNELEGTTSLNHFSIPHGCDGQPVQAQSIVFPNGEDSLAERADTGEAVELADHIEGNPIMSAMPAPSHIFKNIHIAKGPVPAFISHGQEKTEDTRAFHYTKGKLEDGYLGLAPWRGTFPAFKPDSCATALTVYIAIANYCTKSMNEDDDDRADIWIGRLTEKFDDSDVVSVDFWPYLRVVRDLENNPLPVNCGEEFEIGVYPSDNAIDEYLPITGYWPSTKGGGNKHDHDDHGGHGH